MRAILSEKNLVVILFVLVMIAFSFAHEDSKKMEQVFTGVNKYLRSSNSLLTQARQQNFNSEKKEANIVELSQ